MYKTILFTVCLTVVVEKYTLLISHLVAKPKNSYYTIGNLTVVRNTLQLVLFNNCPNNNSWRSSTK